MESEKKASAGYRAFSAEPRASGGSSSSGSLTRGALNYLLRTDGFERNSFHGGLGGPQTRPFMLHPARLPARDEPILAAGALHGVLTTCRAMLASHSPHRFERI